MPCSAMLCFALLCFAMLCYAMLWYALLCYETLCYIMLCHAMLCYAPDDAKEPTHRGLHQGTRTPRTPPRNPSSWEPAKEPGIRGICNGQLTNPLHRRSRNPIGKPNWGIKSNTSFNFFQELGCPRAPALAPRGPIPGKIERGITFYFDKWSQFKWTL